MLENSVTDFGAKCRNSRWMNFEVPVMTINLQKCSPLSMVTM